MNYSILLCICLCLSLYFPVLVQAQNRKTFVAGVNNDHIGVVNPTTDSQTEPLRTPNPPKEYEQLVSGMYFAIGIDTNQAMWSWGEDQNGQLGLGENSGNQLEPQEISLPEGVTFEKIFGGHYHTLAIDNNGNLWGWGRNEENELGLGTGESQSQVSVPTQISGTANSPLQTKIVTAALVRRNSFAIDENGNLWSWGENYGNLAVPEDQDTSVPVQVEFPSEFNAPATAVAASGIGVIVLDAEGYPWFSGMFVFGQEIEYPLKKILEQPLVQIEGELDHFLALDADGKVYSVGGNSYGQLGRDGDENVLQPVEWDIEIGTFVVKVAVGLYKSFAILSDGTLYAWGLASRSQLGIFDGSDFFLSPELSLGNFSVPQYQLADIASGAAVSFFTFTPVFLNVDITTRTGEWVQAGSWAPLLMEKPQDMKIESVTLVSVSDHTLTMPLLQYNDTSVYIPSEIMGDFGEYYLDIRSEHGLAFNQTRQFEIDQDKLIENVKVLPGDLDRLELNVNWDTVGIFSTLEFEVSVLGNVIYHEAIDDNSNSVQFNLDPDELYPEELYTFSVWSPEYDVRGEVSHSISADDLSVASVMQPFTMLLFVATSFVAFWLF